MNEILDERRGMPSASNGGRYEDCPESHELSKPFKNEGGAAAQDGTDCHTYMEGGEVDLRPELLSLCREAEAQRSEVLSFMFEDWEENPPEVVTENRIWYPGNRYSGVPDLLAFKGGKCLCIDYKFGRIAVPHAKDNKQLKWLAALIDRKYSVTSVTVCIIQPSAGGFTMHTYDKAALKKARASVLRTLRKMEGGKTAPKAGDHCKYCPARVACPAAAKQVQALASVNKVEALSADQMSQTLDMLDSVESTVRAIRKRATEMLKDDADAIPGYTLKRASSRRSIADAAAAYHTLKREGLATEGQFLEACSIGVSKVQKMVQSGADVGPAEAARMVNTLLNGNISFKEGEPKPCRVE